MFLKYYKRTACIFVIFLLFITVVTGCQKKAAVPVQISYAEGTSENGDHAKYAIITVRDFGSMKFRLLEEYAPQTVNTFTALAQDGFFDGKPVYMIIRDFCFIAGAEEAADRNAAAGNDEFDGINDKCYPLRGSLCLTSQSDAGGYSAADFTVIGTGSDFLNDLEELLNYKKVTLSEYFKQAYGTDIDKDTLDIFRKYGGAPWLYGHCTVFGQLTEGEEILEKICSVEVSDDARFAPLEEIIVENVRITE